MGAIACDAGGAFSLDARGKSAGAGSLVLQLSDATIASTDARHIGSEGGATTLAFERLRCVVAQDAGQALTIQLTNTSDRSVHVREISLRFPPEGFQQPWRALGHRQLVHGREPSVAGGIKPLHLPGPWSDELSPASELVTIVANDTTGEAFLLGALPPFGDGFTGFRVLHDSLHGQGHCGIEIRFEFQQTLALGATLRSSPVLVLTGGSGEDLLTRYGELMRSRNPRRLMPRATGWNSWDYYAGAVTRADMDENAAACRRLFGDALDYVVIDEGYECMWGVWDANWKFPEGLADFCRHVKSSGMKPGVWTAPLMVNIYTPLYRARPEWFVSRADGNVHTTLLSYGAMAQLDVTHPGVQAHLRGVYGRLVDAGVEYFKVDFTQLVLAADRFHDPTVGRAGIIRRLFEIIRECIGDNRYLLSCLAPFESVVGLADSHRTTGDIHNHWSHIRHNIQAMCLRQWMHGCVGNTDPDFLIVRTAETSDDPQLTRRQVVKPEDPREHWGRGPAMNFEEAKVLALALHLTGADLFLGDALERLNPLGINLLRRVMRPLTAPGRITNLFAPGRELSPTVVAPTDTGWVMGIFNLGEVPVHHCLAFPPANASYEVTDFWTGERVAVSEGQTLLLPPRSARGLVIGR